MNIKTKKYISFAIFIGFFALFFAISYLTPLAGDDWGYAVNGLKGNPFVSAFKFYFTWSGRFFSELWGFLVAPHKWLWNILNPLLFTGILYFMYRIIQPKKNNVAVLLMLIFLILSVKDQLRMETYTWIMGTTYVIPLFLFLIYTYLLKLIFFDQNKSVLLYIACCLINIYIPLCMENIAGGLMLANILVLVYCWFTDKKSIKKYFVFLLISCIGFAILRLSPGSTYRTLNEHQAWTQMNLFEQIAINWNNFLTFTFLNNKYLICLLSLVFMAYTYVNSYKYKKYTAGAYVLMFIFFLGFIQSIAANIYSKVALPFLPYLFDLNLTLTSVVVTVIFVLYVIALFWVISTMMNDYKKWTCLYLMMVAGTCNLVMLVSPIFGARSSIYTVFLFIIVAGYCYEELMSDNNINKVVVVILFGLCLVWSNRYLSKYRLVSQIQKERLEVIQYYQDHPNEKDAWIPRMPILSVHSADIEEWDVYHQEVFKEYYGLNPKMNVIFYWKEKY